MKVLLHPGHGKSRCWIVGNWTLFQFHEDISPLIQEGSSVLTNCRGVGRLLNHVWECPNIVQLPTIEHLDKLHRLNVCLQEYSTLWLLSQCCSFTFLSRRPSITITNSFSLFISISNNVRSHAELCFIRACVFWPEGPSRRRAPDLPSGMHSYPEENQRWQARVPEWTHKQCILYFSVQKWIVYCLWTGQLYGL